MCPPHPPLIHMLNSFPSVRVSGGRALGRCLGHKVGALMNGISILIEETTEHSLAPSVMWGYSKKTVVYEPGSSPSLICFTFLLNFSASKTMRNKFVLFIRYSIYGILLQQPKWTKTKRVNFIILWCELYFRKLT